MKLIFKLAIALAFLGVISGCTGTTYNADRTCTEDYLIHPAISLPNVIGACDSVGAK